MAAQFKFNFLSTDEDDQTPIEEAVSPNDSTHVQAYKLSVDHSMSLYTAILELERDNDLNHVSLSKGTCIHHIPFQHVKKLVEEQLMINEEFIKLVSMTENNSTDLVPGQYEGGFKVWECTYDLLEFLEADPGYGGDKLVNYRVLDLGCGAGLLGIYALIKKASRVDFHDFNHEVLSYLTVPNVMLNQSNNRWFIDSGQSKCGFYCGDWSEFSSVLEQDRDCSVTHYDIILTSETIYSVESQEKLLKLFQSVLSPGGVAYIAAKVHYFGVGGSVSMFTKLVDEFKVFNWEIVNEINLSGLPRIIVKLTLKNS